MLFRGLGQRTYFEKEFADPRKLILFFILISIMKRKMVRGSLVPIIVLKVITRRRMQRISITMSTTKKLTAKITVVLPKC